MAGEVASVVDEQLQTMLASMVDAAEGLCPHVMKGRSLRPELLKTGAGRMSVPRSFITRTLLEQSGVDIINQISEVKLSVASFLSDHIVDEILDSLSRSQQTLADHLIRRDQPLVQQEPQMETEVLDETVLQEENLDQDLKLDRNHDLEDMDTCRMTLKSKRKSILVRMLRPVSVAFEMEFDLDKALEEVPIHVEDPPPPPPPPAQPLDRTSAYYADLPPPPTPVCSSELPPVQHQVLQHRTKLRPKPKKRTKPSRTPRQLAGSSATAEAEPSGIMGKLDEGLDEFFSKTVTKLSLKHTSVKAPPPNPQEAEKKRESRKSGFFNLIKSRTSRSEKSHGAASISPPSPASSSPSVAVASSSSSISPVTEEATLTSPTSPTSPSLKTPEPLQELHKAMSQDHTDSEGEASPPTAAAGPTKEEKEEEQKAEKKENPHVPRHIGVPVMGLDLLAEMKARQERMAAQKSESKVEKVETAADSEDSRPEPVPRSKPSGVGPKPPPPQAAKPASGSRVSGPSGPSSPRSSGADVLDETESGASNRAPLPAPRLKRVQSEQDREAGSVGGNPGRPASPLDGACPADGDAFESPSQGVEVGGRQWSSLKSSVTPPTARDEERERAKSLPAYVTPPSPTDVDADAAKDESASPDADDQSDDEPGDETATNKTEQKTL